MLSIKPGCILSISSKMNNDCAQLVTLPLIHCCSWDCRQAGEIWTQKERKTYKQLNKNKSALLLIVPCRFPTDSSVESEAQKWKYAQTCCSFPPCRYYWQWAGWRGSSPCRWSRAGTEPAASWDSDCSQSRWRPSGWCGMRCAVQTACCRGRPLDLWGFKHGESQRGRSRSRGRQLTVKKKLWNVRIWSNSDIKAQQSSSVLSKTMFQENCPLDETKRESIVDKWRR